MKTRFLALLLVLALCLCLFAGCSKAQETVSNAAETADQAAETAEAAAETTAETAAETVSEAAETVEAAAETAAETVQAEAEAVEEAAEEAIETAEAALDAGEPEEEVAATQGMTPQPAMGISYPIEGNPEISFWYYIPPYSQYCPDNASFYCIPYAEIVTGVHLNFIECSQSAATQQYALMIASGDWPDINPVNEYYTGGLTQAYEDEVVLDLLDYIYDYMPNFAYMFDQLDDTNRDLALNDGHLLSFINIADGSFSGNGVVTRGDWMDEQGISFEGRKTITIDEFTDLLHTFRDAYGVECGIPSSDGTFSVSAAFDVSAPTLIGDGFMSAPGLSIFRYGDEVVSGWTVDAYKDYLQWFYGLIADGTFQKITEVESDRRAQNSMQANGEISAWQANADKLEECADYVEDPANSTFRAQALPTIVADESAEYVWKQTNSLVSNGMSVSVGSDNAELACQWMNYFWTDEGTLLYNYGIEASVAEELGLSATREGVGTWFGSYRLDENGDFEWTAMVTDTSGGGNAEMFSTIYTMQRFATGYQDNDRLLPTFTPAAIEAVELWTLDGTDERYYPSAITLSTEDNELVNRLTGDVTTLGCERILLMLDGQVEINDENWASFVNDINAMGLTEIIEIYQDYYDEYVG